MIHFREIVLIFIFIFSSLTFITPYKQQYSETISQIDISDPDIPQSFGLNDLQFDYNKRDRITQLQNPDFGSQVFKFTKEYLGIETSNSIVTGDPIFAISPDSKLMVSAYDYYNYYSDSETNKVYLKSNYSIYFWDLTTGNLLTELNEFNGTILSLEISPDGRTLAIFYYDHITNKIFLQFRNFSLEKISEYDICDVCYVFRKKTSFSPNGELLAYIYSELGSYQNKIGLFSLKTQSWIPSINFDNVDNIFDFSFTLDSSKIILTHDYCSTSPSSCHSQIILYDINKKIIEHNINNYDNYFQNLVLSSDGSKLAITNSSFVDIWDIVSWTHTLSFKTGVSTNINSLELSKDNDLLFIGLQDSRILIWDLINNTMIKVLNGHTGPVNCLSLSADKTLLISGGISFTIIVWNIIKSKSLLWSLPHSSAEPVEQLIFPSTQISDTKDDVLTVSYPYGSSKININSTRSNSFNLSIPTDLNTNEYFEYAYDLSFDKKIIILGYSSGKIIIWNSSTGSEITNFYIHYGNPISFIKFSPDASIFATLTKYNPSEWGIIDFWNSTTFTKIGNSMIESNITDFKFSPDGKIIANLNLHSDEISVVNLWNVSNGSKVQSMKPCGNFNRSQCFISSFDFSPDGSTMAFAKIKSSSYFRGNSSILFWNYKTNSTVNSATSYESINSLEFSQDGNYLFTVSGEISCCGPIETNGNLKIWNVNSDGLYLQNTYHTDSPIFLIAISKDNSKLAINIHEHSGINTIKMFDISNIPLDVDEDLDGLNDEWEYNYNLSTTNFWNKFNDDDQDGLINSMEFYYGTNPLNNDSNGNGVLDGYEFGFYPSSNPFISISTIEPQISSNVILIFDPMLVLLTSIFLSAWILYAGIIVYRKKLFRKSNTKELVAFTNILESPYFKTIFYKIVAGLENIKKFWFTKYPDDELELIINNKTTEYTEIINLFPLDIQQELKSELRGRTILILIELAYQFPNHSHVTAISKALEIPQATVSFEIKKLITLQYIEQNLNITNLQDTRFKYYSLTSKGTLFLHLLKESLTQGLELINKPI